MPAITACLMVSLLDISIVHARLHPGFPENCSMAARVPEPLSRAMKANGASDATPGWSTDSSGWSSGADKDHAGVPQRAPRGWPPPWRAAHDGNVHLARRAACHQLLAVAHGQSDVDAFVIALELRQQVRQEVLGRADHADGQLPCLQALHAGQRRPRRPSTPPASACMHQQVLARGGQRHLAACPRSNSGRPTWPSSSLTCIDTAGGVRCSALRAWQAALTGDLAEHPQLAEGDVHD
jgi:hypothetical protein